MIWRAGRALALAAACVGLIGVTGCGDCRPAQQTAVAVNDKAPLLTFSALLARPRQTADEKIAYGSDPRQFGELWLPKSPGAGLLPVVVLIHGGCWKADLPGLELMDYLAADLRDRGYAVWNIEYRRIGHPGGGYPGTFQDVARAIDHLRAFSREQGLDLKRVVFIGHSAGGQLATWAAARDQLPKDSPLRFGVPVQPRGVVSLAGINDLEDFRASGPDRCGGPGTIDALVDARRSGDLYADTSPARLKSTDPLPVIVSGARDPIVPAAFGERYAASLGHGAKAIVTPGGHFELIDPGSVAWRERILPFVGEAAGRVGKSRG